MSEKLDSLINNKINLRKSIAMGLAGNGSPRDGGGRYSKPENNNPSVGQEKRSAQRPRYSSYDRKSY